MQSNAKVIVISKKTKNICIKNVKACTLYNIEV